MRNGCKTIFGTFKNYLLHGLMDIPEDIVNRCTDKKGCPHIVDGVSVQFSLLTEALKQMKTLTAEVGNYKSRELCVAIAIMIMIFIVSNKNSSPKEKGLAKEEPSDLLLSFVAAIDEKMVDSHKEKNSYMTFFAI